MSWLRDFKKIIFLLLLSFAIFLRFFEVNTNPPSLNWDEVSLGYNAYSILKTGKDEWGETLPLSFRAYGDFKLPAYVYVDVPFIAVFGLNEIGVRLPSMLAGVLTVILVYLIIKELTQDEPTALLGMFLITILPWHIILSRIALEANLALLLITTSIYFLILVTHKKRSLILSALFLGLSLFTYNSSRVVALPLAILAIGFFFPTIKKIKRVALLSLLVFLGFFIVAIPIAFLQDSSARYRWTQILDEGAINRINELRGSSALPPLAKELTINKVTYFIPEVFKGYISHFNPDFLFISGGSNYQYSVPGSGLILWVMLPILIAGVIFVAKSKKREFWFVLGWLLVSPLPAAITRDAPHSLRSLFMIPPLIIISTLGIIGISKYIGKIPKLLFISFLVIGGIVNFTFFWQNYSGPYKSGYSWSWQYGYKEVVDFVNLNQDHYGKVVISKKYGEPHEFMLFYSKYNPEKYRVDANLVRYQRSDWYWVDGFDKYLFLNDWEIKEKSNSEFVSNKGTGKSLLVTSPGNFPEGMTKIKTVYFLDGKAAFDILETNE